MEDDSFFSSGRSGQVRSLFFCGDDKKERSPLQILRLIAGERETHTKRSGQSIAIGTHSRQYDKGSPVVSRKLSLGSAQALLNETHDYVEFVEEDAVASLQIRKKANKNGDSEIHLFGGFDVCC